MGKIACPKCEKDDQIQKVSSLVTSGISTTNYKNSFGNIETASSQTRLSSRLSPPAKPVHKPNLLNNVLLFIGIYLIGTVIDFLSQSNIFGGLSLIVGLGFIIWISVTPSNKHKTLLSEWERKIDNWNELYYCYRDDCVFDPRNGKTASASNLERLL